MVVYLHLDLEEKEQKEQEEVEQEEEEEEKEEDLSQRRDVCVDVASK